MNSVMDRAVSRTNGSMRWIPLALLVACTHDHDVVVGAGSDYVVKQMPTSPDLDVLFVIDNSAQIADKQNVFAQAFPAFVAALDTYPGGRPNLHLGVVDSTVDIGAPGFGPGCPSPDPHDNGLLQNTKTVAGCTPPAGLFISDIANDDGTRTTNYGSDLADTLACIGEVGESGCGFESPMLSILRALDGTNPDNAGFLRPDADLAIVILNDEDDCSAVDPTIFELPADTVGGLNDFRCQPLFAYDCDQPITAGSGSATYTNCRPHPGGYLLDVDALPATLAKIKDPSQTSVSLIAGNPETTIETGSLPIGGSVQDPALFPSCRATINGNPAVARPAIRLSAFAQHYIENTFDTVCQPDYSDALGNAGSAMTTMMTSPCLAGTVDATDTDAVNPGLQPDCTVVDHINDGTSASTDLTMPACPMSDATLPDPNGPRPCWWAATDETCVPLGSELALHVERAAAAPAGTVVAATCKLSH